MRSERLRELIRILRSGRATSQSEIVTQLRAAGHEVTQATISRDLQEIGALKMRSGEGHVYRLPDEMARSHGDLVSRSLTRTLEEFALELKRAGGLVVVTTAPGHAAAVARAIDLSGEPDVVGTVAGDDTIFVATPSDGAAALLIDRWSHRSSAEVV